ncbi:MAG: tetratricopeptide repeat protein [Gemmatimonadaceae bacterium]|nr:tetratricopeptide repeat protein [Gemmatimonadaceae bacterium]
MTREGGTWRSEHYSRYLWVLIAALAVAASITGLRNGFAFDDVDVIIKNPRLHTFAAPWGLLVETYWRAEMGSMLYRPMTMVVFAAQWVVGGGSPLPFHLTSILLYAALSVAVYRLAILLMPARAAFVSAALFAVHPVHVEAVANIVGQAELWVALLLVVLVAWYVWIRRAGPLRTSHIALISVGYLIACGFKEHAIVLPALLLAAELLVVGDERPLRARVRNLIPLCIAMAITGLAFLAARYAVLDGVAIDSRAQILKEQPFGTRFFTMLDVVVEWVRLFFWPMSLSADYSYPRIRTHTTFEISMLPAVAVLAGIAWIAWAVRKRLPVVTFGISWTGLALLIPSNLIVVTGFVLAERTLLLATVGFVLCAGVAVHEALTAADRSGGIARPLAVSALGALLLVFAGRSVTRSPVWRDNETLVLQTVRDVPSSHRAHWMRAADLAGKKRTAEALDEMDLAVALGRRDDPLLLAYGGDMFAMAGRCPRALTLYRRALALAPGNIQLRVNTSWCLLNVGKLEEAKAMALDAGGNAGDIRLQEVARAADSLQLVRARKLASR